MSIQWPMYLNRIAPWLQFFIVNKVSFEVDDLLLLAVLVIPKNYITLFILLANNISAVKALPLSNDHHFLHSNLYDGSYKEYHCQKHK